MFLKLLKNSVNVSHKIFHNPQMPGLCGFITDRAVATFRNGITCCLLKRYARISQATENRVAPSILTALINFD